MKIPNPLPPALLFVAIASTVLLPRAGHGTDLVEAYNLAVESDPEFRRVAAANRAVMELKPQAIAQLLPAVQGRGNTYSNDQDISSAFIPVGEGGGVEFNSHGYSIDLSQPLFRYDRFIRLRQANSRIQQAGAEYASAEQALMVRLAERYFLVLANMDNLAFAEAEEKSLSRQLDQAKQRFDVGLTAITDVQEAQAGFDRAVAQKIAAANGVDNAREALREIIGIYLEAQAAITENMPFVPPDPADPDQWTDTALAQNLDIAAAMHAVESSRQEIKVQNTGHLPTLDAVASYGYDKTGGRFGATKIHSDAVGLELNVPLFQGGFVSSRAREARARLDVSLEQLEIARRNTQRKTREAYLGVISGISQVYAFKQALISSETALRATEAGFEVGTRTAVDVIAAERVLSQSKRDYARAKYEYIQNSLRLKQAAGTLSHEDLAQINQWLSY
ncbi:MAG: TolC family outer membrane protein [Gammaproteobacteria bacterium]|nr:TolC family outer membrane protein [Gammaproteobacteria bacterium]